MGYKTNIMEKIRKNKEIKQLINQSKDLDSFFKEAEKIGLFNDFSLLTFFYRPPSIVIDELLSMGMQFNVNNNTIKTINNEQELIIEEEYSNLTEYRIINMMRTEWAQIESWMAFFIKLGEFVRKQSNINVYINYIDDVIPTLFISLGVIYAALSELSNENKEVVEIEDGLEVGPGDEVAYLDGNGWRRATIIAIEKDDNAYSERFNPYIRLQVERAKGNGTLESVPRTLWSKKIRMSANYKKTSGSVVRLNDDLSENLIKRCGNDICEKLKFYNEKYINLIGSGIEKNIEEIIDFFKFRDKYGEYTMKDYIYFSERGLNYSNVNIIKSDKFEPYNSEEVVSVFVGSSSALNLNQYKTLKNIYIINRKRLNLLNNEVLETQVSQEMVNQKNDKLYSELQIFLENHGVKVPKGCELIVY
ncbi:hypothetical protein ACTQ5F_05635 [Jeotgalibaca porci]|uniref:hypothetical protein n=1 Tax=Jeotgalibaca porci TaxID=1868793 RepID=UPI003F93AB76